jgi:hypothetical protein
MQELLTKYRVAALPFLPYTEDTRYSFKQIAGKDRFNILREYLRSLSPDQR